MDMNKLKELMAAKKASMKRIEKTVKVEPGKNRVRILPGWEKGNEHVWFHDFGQHFIKNAADQIQAVYVCNSSTFEQPCEVCSAIQAAGRSIHDDETQAVLDKAKPSRVVLVNALMLDSKEPNTPVILEIKRQVFGGLLEILEEWGPEAFFDLDTGKEILISRDGKGLNTKYSVQISPKSYPVPAAVLSKLNDLGEYVKQESAEQRVRAIAAVNSVAGILPAPKTRDTPATVGEVFEDVPDLSATRASSPSPSLDTELDDLLGDLNDGS